MQARGWSWSSLSCQALASAVGGWDPDHLAEVPFAAKNVGFPGEFMVISWDLTMKNIGKMVIQWNWMGFHLWNLGFNGDFTFAGISWDWTNQITGNCCCSAMIWRWVCHGQDGGFKDGVSSTFPVLGLGWNLATSDIWPPTGHHHYCLTFLPTLVEGNICRKPHRIFEKKHGFPYSRYVLPSIHLPSGYLT